MSWLFYTNPEEISKYFEKQRIERNNQTITPQIKPKSLDDIVGLLTFEREKESLVFISLEDLLLKRKASYETLKISVSIFSLDISIIPDRGLLVLGDDPREYVSIWSNKGLLKKFGEDDTVVRVFYDGKKYLYHTGCYGIKRIDLGTLIEETVILREEFESNRRMKCVDWLQFRDGRWYVLLENEDETYILYSTKTLEDVKSWKKEIHWYTKHNRITSFDFLPDGSIISTIPLLYLDINGKEKVEVEKPEDWYIYRLRVLTINDKKAYVFYAGNDFIGYVLLRRDSNKWHAIESKYFEEFVEPIELVTGEGYEKVVKHFIDR